jgi:hypothetical protein
MYRPQVDQPAVRAQTATQQKPFYFGGSQVPLLGAQMPNNALQKKI